MSDMQTVIQKIMSDANFRQALLKDPEGALKANGITPSPEMLKAFKGLDEAGLQALASSYSADKAAC